MSSLSFNWKQIEQKPDNASIVRLLIEDVTSSNSKTNVIKQPDNVLEHFLSFFKTENIFEFEQTKKENKKLSSKEQIITQNEIKNILSDFNQFELNNDNTLKRVEFFIKVNYFLYIIIQINLNIYSKYEIIYKQLNNNNIR